MLPSLKKEEANSSASGFVTTALGARVLAVRPPPPVAVRSVASPIEDRASDK